MKKNLLILLLSVILLQACQKENQSTVVTPPANLALKLDSNSTPPVTGDVQPSSIGSTIVNKKLNLTLGYNKHVFLDVNNDGVVDFAFVSALVADGNNSYLYLLCNPRSGIGNKLLVSQGPDLVFNANWGVPFAQNQLIDAATSANQSKWSNDLQMAFIVGISHTEAGYDGIGLWPNLADKYLGFKFTSNGKTCYGWLRMNYNAAKVEVTLNDYAYNTVAGQGIKAGDK